jgi:hypothetical protein
MGIILFFFSISELLLPSGVKILIDENCAKNQISVGFELTPNTKIEQNSRNLFEKSGYNFYYLKNADSLKVLSRFISLISSEKIFHIEREEGPINLLRLVLNDFDANSSPVLNITFVITGKIDENKILELTKSIPDSIISNSTTYYKLERVIGKQLYRGEKNFIANISPSPSSDDFCAFLVFLKLMNNRNFKVTFSPETSPSPFLIYLSDEKTSLLREEPGEKEIKKTISDVLNWMNHLMLGENRSRFLILTASMGIEENTFKNWTRELKYLEASKVRKIWEKYLISGFVASLDTNLIRRVQEIFPESNLIE